MASLPSVCIAAKLAAAGFGTVGTDIYVDYRPPTPDNLIAVFSYAGSQPERTHDTSGNMRPGIQVWVRNKNAASASAIAAAVFDTLDGISNTTLTDRFFVSIAANQSPAPMGKDENGRVEYAVNFSTIIQR